MKEEKNFLFVFIICILLLIISIILLFNSNDFLDNIIINRKAEQMDLFSYEIVDNQNDEKIKILIKVNSEVGIEYVEEPNGNKINTNGKTNIGIDYEIPKDEEKIFKIKEVDNDEIENRIINITDEIIGKTAVTNLISESIGYKTIQIDSNINLSGYKTYYQIGKSGEWKEGTGKISILDYDVTRSNLLNDDNTITITTKLKNDVNGAIVLHSLILPIDITSTIDSYTANSLIEAMQVYDFETGTYKIKVENETYNVKVYSFDKDQILSGQTTLGTQEDVATDSREAQNMVILKVKGNLTVNSGVTLTAYKNPDGYGGPKGMMVYCTETLTNNGTISMTARGARAIGQDVYLWRNADNSYEYVPKDGCGGGIGSTLVKVSKPQQDGEEGEKGYDRKTGGGGAGGNYNNSYYESFNFYETTISGNGANGTSYSGGSRRRVFSLCYEYEWIFSSNNKRWKWYG